MAIQDQDQRERRCPMLGHEVSFHYCRTQEGNRLCTRILDCWWQTFDVCGFLQANLPADEFGRLASAPPRPPKVASLAELIAKARERVAAERDKGEQG